MRPGIVALSFAGMIQLASAQTSPPPMPACTAAEHRQFDFWLGEWDVTKPDGQPAGHSRIEKMLDGCAILEQWTSAHPPYAGKSFNVYNAQTRHWEQFWVDNGGARLYLTGGLVDGRMVLRGQQDTPDAKTGRIQRERVTWTPNADGSVRQLWETSTDDGTTWSVSFDGLYRHAAGARSGK